MAVVSATSGGGDDSHNRLQVVVVDNGVGIVDSVRTKAAALATGGQRTQCLSNGDTVDAEIAVDVISNLLRFVYGNRAVVGARRGHGLYTIGKHVSRWSGTMNVISSFAPGRVIHLGRRGRVGEWNAGEFAVEGVKGTVVHLTLDVVKQERPHSSKMRHPEPAAV